MATVDEKNPGDESSGHGGGILDTVSYSQQSATLRSFNPQSFISEYLMSLKPRDKQVLMARYGLEDGTEQTLEQIGKKMNLTRERVRQIEKESLRKLETAPLGANLKGAVELIFQIIEEHGEIMREITLLDALLVAGSNEVNRRAVLFILQVVPRFSLFAGDEKYHRAWYVAGLDWETIAKISTAGNAVFEQAQKPQKRDAVLRAVREELGQDTMNMSDEVLENYLSLAVMFARNSFGEWGLTAWPEIKPRDIGDKAFLVLQHHGKPEHYAQIAEMINKQSFDRRLAHKETVHNELIKDERFVLVGRGIYALKKWGFQKGVVADIIAGVLRDASSPLSRDEIVSRVMKQRLVKKNTIIVGLANRKLFKKTEDNKYINAE